MSCDLQAIICSMIGKKIENREQNTYIVDNHANMACASLLIGFTSLMIELSQSGHNIGKVIQTEQNELNNE